MAFTLGFVITLGERLRMTPPHKRLWPALHRPYLRLAVPHHSAVNLLCPFPRINTVLPGSLLLLPYGMSTCQTLLKWSSSRALDTVTMLYGCPAPMSPLLPSHPNVIVPSKIFSSIGLGIVSCKSQPLSLTLRAAAYHSTFSV